MPDVSALLDTGGSRKPGPEFIDKARRKDAGMRNADQRLRGVRTGGKSAEITA